MVTLGSSVVDGRLLAMRCTNGGLPDAVWAQPRASRSDGVRGGALTQGPPPVIFTDLLRPLTLALHFQIDPP